MKPFFLILFNLLIINNLAIAQSVTLATTKPVSPSKGTVVYDNATNQLQYWNGAWIPITNAASGTGWALSGNDINNNNAGNVGVGTANPTAKFSVQTVSGNYGILHTDGNISVGTYVGSGTGWLGTYSNHPLAFFTNNSQPLMTLSTNGFLGIGTTNPQYPLEVMGLNVGSQLSGTFFQQGDMSLRQCNPTCALQTSIKASNYITASGIAAYSDARIKDIIGVSNSAKDLETIKALEITDYTMKDKIKNGNKPFKKVIAQQVEKFYPQAVSKSTEVVPDIYALAEKVVFDETNKMLTCSLSKSYGIKVGEKIEFIHEKEGKIKAEIVAVSGNNFTVKDWKFPTDKLFVYGREVNDFRSVDYEAISMLGISAIQELAKENEELKTEIKKLKANSQQLNARLEAIEAALTQPIGK